MQKDKLATKLEFYSTKTSWQKSKTNVVKEREGDD